MRAAIFRHNTCDYKVKGILPFVYLAPQRDVSFCAKKAEAWKNTASQSSDEGPTATASGEELRAPNKRIYLLSTIPVNAQ